MRVLLDENVPRKLKWQISAEVVTVPEMGWSGVKNGKLIQLAQGEFDVLLTLDKGISSTWSIWKWPSLCSLRLAVTLMI